jgi:hypothetical protein
MSEKDHALAVGCPARPVAGAERRSSLDRIAAEFERLLQSVAHQAIEHM